MKIAVNTRFLLSGRLEGIGGYLYETLHRMVLAHPEDTFLFFFDRPYSDAFVFAPNVVPLVLFPPARHPFLFVWWYEWSVARALRKYQPDVFLSADNFTTLHTDIPSVLVVHDLAYAHYPEYVTGLVRWYYRFFMPRFLRKADHLIAVSEYTRNDIIRLADIPEGRVTVAYNGSRAIFKPLDAASQEAVRAAYTDGKPYFFYVGAIHPRKNVARLIAAFDRFKAQSGAPHCLIIAGRMAWQTGEVSEALARSPYREDIRLPGYVDTDTLYRLTASAFAMTYVSLFEGFGVPILESLCCGVPVITSATSSMPEVAGDAGLLVDPLSVDQIADAMLRLYAEEGLRAQLAAHCVVQCRKFDWGETAARIYKVLKEIRRLGD